MKLICYSTDGTHPLLRPAPRFRDWMDATPDRYAYRCLPLNIANACGWQVLLASGFTAVWDGSAATDAITITPDDNRRGPSVHLPISHFGSGILTFHLQALFRTEPGVQLFVTGPLNEAKDGISPLSGIIETDWAPYSFTMNWRFTRPSCPVHFAAGEPYCQFFPLGLAGLEAIEPEFKALESDPELAAAHQAWAESRRHFLQELPVAGSSANTEGWQRGYFLGQLPNGQRARIEHRTKLQIQPFQSSDQPKD